MNKKALSYFFLLLALFIGATIYSPSLQSPLISALNSLKNSYFNTISSIEETFHQHFFQAKTIKELTQEAQKCKRLKIEMQGYKNELDALYKEHNSTLAIAPEIELVRALSYQKFGDFTRLWMDVPDYNASKIYGLLYNDNVAGIIINKNNKPLALLNNDLKSTYAVYVGNEKAPGIAHGNNGKNIVVSFIPAWFTIHIGDEVETSGLDKIFFAHLKVGKVIALKQVQGYQKAIVAPYFQANKPDYFYMIRSTR
jgi:rod shape-determining protein MreC